MAEGFAKGGGVVFEFTGDWNTRKLAYLSDVSWICTSLKPFTHTQGNSPRAFFVAKFPSEREQLTPPDLVAYKVMAVKVVDGLQHVVLVDRLSQD